MGYYVSNLFGIRMGGVFSVDADMDEVRRRVQSLVLSMRDDIDHNPPLGGEDGDPSHCMSGELVGSKGGFVVIAGTFNYWSFDRSTEFARRLSEVFETEVMHMCWDQETDDVQCQMYLAGRPMLEASEDPVGRVLRRKF